MKAAGTAVAISLASVWKRNGWCHSKRFKEKEICDNSWHKIKDITSEREQLQNNTAVTTSECGAAVIIQ